MSDEDLWESGYEPGLKDKGGAEPSWEPGPESRISERGEPGESDVGSKQSTGGPPFPSSPSLEYQSTDEPKVNVYSRNLCNSINQISAIKKKQAKNLDLHKKL